jgi:septal ring factor EnvC (AmiA/AmiB activator)
MKTNLTVSSILSIGLALCLALPAAFSHAEQSPAAQSKDPKVLEKQLKDLEIEINKFKQMLETTSGERSKLEKNLQTNEQSINELMKKIETIQQQLTKGENKVSTLRRDQSGLETARQAQQTYLVRQIRAAYEMGNQPFMKVLLNQEDPNQLDRMLTYYDYFNRARAEQIDRYRATIAELEQVTQAIETENQLLTDNRAKLLDEEQRLQLTRRDKQQNLAGLNKEIAAAGTEIKKLSQNRQALEALLSRINDSVLALSSPAEAATFASSKGKMQLPVAGTILNRYGSQRANAKLKWNGIFIAANEGDPVYAIHYGRVVFSDWLRGFGLMIIISHGEGYMSLYGHNQVLYRETGDWVQAGESIATVGDSGGQSQMGLYFEIRNSGKPTNPQQWCQTRKSRAA